MVEIRLSLALTFSRELGRIVLKPLHLLLSGLLLAASQPTLAAELPRLVAKDGRHALLVDGKPFLILGAQANNSSNYPDMLPRVWPMLDRIHANTLEMPVAWQQVEPTEGQFDFSFVDELLKQARANDKKLVLLWFGTWKNTAPSYVPDWVKLDNKRFPRAKKPDGSDHYLHSPHARATLEADKKAFVALMQHLKAVDAQNTVILVQPQNEVGSYNNPRDFSPEAEKLFRQPIPPALAKATGKSGTWAQAFGKGADRAFNSWYMARFIDEMAAAGKAVKPIPMFVNAALHSPFGEPEPSSVSSGGPQWDVLDIWKAAAPNIDFAAPDIYSREEKTVSAWLDGYTRADNALFVPEIGNAADYARFFWAVLGRGGIGFAPFGMDSTDFYNYPLGAKRLDDETLHAFADKFALFSRIGRDWAKIAYVHPTWGVARPDDGSSRATQMGDWKIEASFEQWQFGHKDWAWMKRDPVPWAGKPVGGAAVAQIAPNQFLVAGDHVRLTFSAGANVTNGLMLKVEEGGFTDGKWVTSRVWNGDQVDYGLTFNEKPALLRVTMGSYK